MREKRALYGALLYTLQQSPAYTTLLVHHCSPETQQQLAPFLAHCLFGWASADLRFVLDLRYFLSLSSYLSLLLLTTNDWAGWCWML
jgi:hypothetical protein